MKRGLARCWLPLRLWLLLGLLPACAHTFTVQAPVTLPARVPVYVFPAVWVAGGENQEEIYLLDRIANHLARDRRREVRRVQGAELEPARQAGQISGLTGVLRLKMNFRTDERTVQNTMPMQYCGLYGCGMMAYQTYNTVVPVLQGVATLSVYEGPTARELSHETFTESTDGESDDDEARREVVEHLADTLLRAVDLDVGQERFQVQESGLPDADKGVAALAAGRFREARQLLEKACIGLGGYKREPQARALHALGVARLLESQPALPSARNFDDAQRVLKLAYQQAPSELRRATLEAVALWRKQEAVLREQQFAADHNFRLAREAAASLPPAAPSPTPAADTPIAIPTPAPAPIPTPAPAPSPAP